MVRKVHPLFELHREMNRVFDDFQRDFLPYFDENASHFQPQLDITEDDKAYALHLEIPGMDADDVTIEVRNNFLVIKGEKATENESEDQSWHRRERSFGSFQRTLEMPAGIDEDEIAADFNNGVLKITLPKSETLQQDIKKIAVNKKKT
jgi:HSP20 family protein